MSEEWTGEGTTAQRAASFLGKAASRAKRQAELVTLNTVSLPKLYHAVGKYLMSMAKLPSDLEQRREIIRQLEARTAAKVELGGGSDDSVPQGGFAAKAASFARDAARSAVKAGSDAARTAQIQGEYVALGKAAADKYGEKVLPSSEREKYKSLMARRAQLTAELDQGLNTRPSPVLRYAALAGALVLILGVGLVGRSFLSRGAPRPPDIAQPPGSPDWLVAAAQDAELDKAWRNAKTIDVRVARQAVASGADLSFPSLKTLTPQVADILAGTRHDLSFPSLESISVDTAEALAAHQGGESRTGIGPTDGLGLQGLRQLPDGVAAALAAHQGSLIIGSEARPIPRLSDAAAKSLGKSRSRSLRVFVGDIGKVGQDALASYEGSLELDFCSF